MKQALNRLALYASAMNLAIYVSRDGFRVSEQNGAEVSQAVSVDELADRVEAMNSAPVSAQVDPLESLQPGEALAAINTLQDKGYTWHGGQRWAPPLGKPPRFLDADAFTFGMVPGYEQLAQVLAAAFNQAARGKGKERHAKGQPFHEQVMQVGAQHFGAGALLFQAFKKSEESQRLPHERAEAELLGAIVYLAGAVIANRRTHADRNQAANDPHAQVAANA